MTNYTSVNTSKNCTANSTNYIGTRPATAKALDTKRLAADMTISMVAICAIAIVGFAALQSVLA